MCNSLYSDKGSFTKNHRTIDCWLCFFFHRLDDNTKTNQIAFYKCIDKPLKMFIHRTFFSALHLHCQSFKIPSSAMSLRGHAIHFLFIYSDSIYIDRLTKTVCSLFIVWKCDRMSFIKRFWPIKFIEKRNIATISSSKDKLHLTANLSKEMK